MLRRIFFLTVIAAAAAAGQPAFEISGGKSFDFGELFTLVPVFRELTIRNAGDDTLRIRDVSGSCGCTGMLLSNSDIPPGGSGVLRITFDPAKFSGGVEKVVSMHTNDPKEPNPHITFTAEINRILELDQDHLVLYTEPDSQTNTVLNIRNRSGIPVRITRVSSSPPELTTELSTNLLPPGGEASLLCSIRPSAPGIIRGDLVIETDHPSVPVLSLRYFCYTKRTRTASGPSPDR
ncbi:MAG TPA: DUF1573 domain-containing protein [Bacteroidota bacterium]|nr:DUF1573 domain-containing protein [Bacteroidota bacterium]